MSSSPFKGGLAPGGPTFADKAKLQMRRPTPDSDAVASSDDDHEHVPRAPRPTNVAGARRPSTGWLHDIQPTRKYSLPSVALPGSGSQPTTPSLELPQQQGRPGTSGFLWNTSSFTSPQSGSKLKDVVPSPTTTNHPTGDKLFSPPGGEIDEGIGFLLNQQNPVRKSVRSQSYSIGQGDIESSPLGQFSAPRNRLRHRPSKPSLLGEGPGLGQLREDDLDEIESSNGSEGGMRLPTGYWEQEHKRDQEKGLRKQAAEQNARARYRAASTASPHLGFRLRDELASDPYAVMMEEFEDPVVPQQPLTRRFSEHVTGVDRKPKMDHLTDNMLKNPWGGSPTLPSVVSENLGRRHSFATYSTQQHAFQPSTLTYNEEDEDVVSPTQRADSPENQQPFDASAYFTGYGPASRAINASAISAAHPEPIAPQTNANTSNPYAVPPVLGRPGRRLFVVTFKCSRADIYYLYDNTGLEIRAGDLVITEGDRGCDLGQVSHADVSLEDAKKFKAEALDEHFRWLVMFSQYSLAGAKDVGMLGALARANGFPNMNRAALTSMGGQQEQDTKPKMIKRLAQQHEIAALRDKEGSEAKAKRLGAQKAVEHKLPMEILDAEFQADYHKLTFFYYAENYVNFNALVTDVFKQYKIRIWMSAVNPASVVNPAGIVQIQPPSAIGPGAIMHSRTSNAPAAVGPGFGAGSYRQNEQQQQQPQQQQQRGRANVNTTQGQYEQSYYPYTQQLSGYPVSQQYNMPAYNQNQYSQYDAYGRYPGYPNASASGTPMNYGAYQPPTTFAASPAFNNASSGPSYRGGYPSTSSAPSGSYGGQYTTGGSHQTATGYGNGYVATTASYDPSLVAAMQGMNFNTN